MKKALKYALLKTDFVRALAADETIKEGISDDMFEVPVIEVDADTGEVLEA